MEGSTEINAAKHECLQDEEDFPTSKKQRSSPLEKTDEKPDAPSTNSRAFIIAEAATHKLAKLVENHPQFHSRMEEMLQDIYRNLNLKYPLLSGDSTTKILPRSTSFLMMNSSFVSRILVNISTDTLQVRRIGSNKSMMPLAKNGKEPASIVR